MTDESGKPEVDDDVAGSEAVEAPDAAAVSNEEEVIPQNRIAKFTEDSEVQEGESSEARASSRADASSEVADGESMTSEESPSGDEKPKPKRKSRKKKDAPTVAEGETEDEEVLETLSPERLQAAVEALLFASGEPLSLGQLHRLVPEATKADLRAAIDRLRARTESEDCGYALSEQGKSFRLLTRPDLAPFVTRLRGDARRVRLSKAAFETLAVIAYRQPMKRADIDSVRGVQSGAILRTLMEWNLVSVIGRDEDAIGRPLLYGTTEVFLEQFGLPAIEQLPDPEDFGELAE